MGEREKKDRVIYIWGSLDLDVNKEKSFDKKVPIVQIKVKEDVFGQLYDKLRVLKTFDAFWHEKRESKGQDEDSNTSEEDVSAKIEEEEDPTKEEEVLISNEKNSTEVKDDAVVSTTEDDE